MSYRIKKTPYKNSEGCKWKLEIQGWYFAILNPRIRLRANWCFTTKVCANNIFLKNMRVL